MLRRIALTTAALAMLSLSPGGVAAGQPLAPGCPWTTVPSPNGGQWENRLQDVAATSRSDAWAVGWYTHSRHGPTLTLIEHWDGSHWRIVPSPSPGTESNQLWGVSALSPTDAWAVGTTSPGTGPLVEHWDGTSWSLVPAPSPSGRVSLLYDVSAAAADDVWAVGLASNTHATPAAITLTERWNGVSWSVVPSPNDASFGVNQLFGVVAFPTGEAFAVGSGYPLSVYHPGAFAFRWTGAAWTADPTRGASFLSDVTGTAPDDVWAVGSHGRSVSQTLIQHWDGTAWKEAPSPNPAPADYLEAVAAFSRSSALAIGAEAGQTPAIAERWNGRTWRVAKGTPASFPFRLAAIPGTNDALAVGLQDAGPAHTVTLVQRYCLG